MAVEGNITASQRVLVGTAATLSGVYLDYNGEPASPGGSVTVGVTRADGTVLVSPGTATSAGTGTGEYTVTTPVTTRVDILVATWTNGTVSWITYHEVVGGFFFSVADARAYDPVLNDSNRYSDALIRRFRDAVERECESDRACRQAFVPRFARVRLDGRGGRCLQLPHRHLRRVLSVREYSDETTYTSYSAGELAAIPPNRYGEAVRTDDGWWDCGHQNIVIEYEYGWESPPLDIKNATMTRLRERLNSVRTGIPDRAISWVGTDGGTFRISTPGMGGAITGIPDVDAVYSRYRSKAVAG